MPQTRKLVRTAMRTALADASSGFNVQIAAVAATYGIAAFAIDWGAGSTDFLQSNVDRAGIESSRLITGIKVAMYTTDAIMPGRDEPSKFGGGGVFDGDITARLDFTVEYDSGVELTEDLTEEIADAIEDAVLRVLVDKSAEHSLLFRGGAPIYYSNDFAASRTPIEPTEDGYSQTLQFQFIYGVKV